LRKSIFCIILCLLLVAFVLSLALGWHEADVQGWWPLALAVGALVASTYAALFSLLLPPDLSRSPPCQYDLRHLPPRDQ
jgi:hypothetical protein